MLLSNSWETMDFPNVRSYIRKNVNAGYFPPAPVAPLLQLDDPTAAWIQFCKQTAQPCYDYFSGEVMLHPCFTMYRACRLYNPDAMKSTPKNAAQVRELVKVLQPKLLSDQLLDRMIAGLADYQIASFAISFDSLDMASKLTGAEDFWASHPH
jgi:hypothetical protein